MQEIYLTLAELRKLVEIVETFNPPDDTKLGTGQVKVKVDSSSGIGSIVQAEVPMFTNGHRGSFVVTVTDESSW